MFFEDLSKNNYLTDKRSFCKVASHILCIFSEFLTRVNLIKFALQDFQCPSQCICKGHVIYCSHTSVDMYSIPINVTLLYLVYVTDDTHQPYDKQLETYKDLSLLNISNSIVVNRVIYNFLLFLPNLHILLMRNTSITDLSSTFFTRLPMLTVLDLQGNFIHVLSSGGFNGSISVPSLDLHGMTIRKIKSRAFEGLLSLHLLNLSYNNIDHLYDGRFQYLVSLKVLDLRGNIFKSIQLYTFTGLHILLFTTYQQTCCYAEVWVACSPIIRRYVLYLMYDMYLHIYITCHSTQITLLKYSSHMLCYNEYSRDTCQ